jgi:electron transfer flavoprotein alpha subunit
MSVLIYAENSQGQFKKGAFEVVTYGRKVADMLGQECVALVLGKSDGAGVLGKYGAHKVVQCDSDLLVDFDAQVYASCIAEAAQKLEATTVVITHSSKGKSLLGRLAIKMEAGTISGANALPNIEDGFVVSKNVYSGKAVAYFTIPTENKIISLIGNSISPEIMGDEVKADNISLDVPSPKIKVLERKTVEGTVPLPEAELVVSAGRGMKGPENWGIIEELADVIGATTACSRPVADTGWRPHHEHVGQTGVAIRPNLYIAAGISGAIQHLAGVNNSKVIVVINKDPEAPFFKAADYGVVADLFEVVPKLTEAFKKFKAAK